MDDRRKTIAALTIIAGAVVLTVIIIGVFVSGKKTVSPVPDEGAIRVIFMTPTPVDIPTLEPTPTTTPKAAVKASATSTPKPTVKPTISISPTKASSPSATPTP